jgi:acetyl-CoA carboxylase carboxyltransferase component
MEKSTITTRSPLIGTVVAINVSVGDPVRAGHEVIVLESMKMEHPITADGDGTIAGLAVAVGETVEENQVLFTLTPGTVDTTDASTTTATPTQRADLARYDERRRLTTDEARPAAVEKRHAKGQRTARENIADLVDPGSFHEVGAFGVAAQRQRRNADDLIANTPADGLVGGTATIGGKPVAVASYDYTVLAGTQGLINHIKKDRLFAFTEAMRLPFVLFAEGGGGRPGDTDSHGVTGMDCMAFSLFGALSGLVPLVGIASGYCFAGNAALLGCCDVIIATENSNIGMAGPAMIEGGGLGRVEATSIGDIDTQTHNGVVDEAEAVVAAKRYLDFFLHRHTETRSGNDLLLRDVVPEQRTRVYPVRDAITHLVDGADWLELRPSFGVGIVTALARIGGHSVGIIANNPAHLGGAIDTDASDKASRFVQLCDAHDLPIVSLCDTPGFMVGPEAEKSAQVRHFGRMFVTAGSITVPWITVVLRKCYGLGAQAMAGGTLHGRYPTLSWPTGEFGGMGLEGAVRLGYRKEIESIADPVERQALEDKLIAAAYERGSALNIAAHAEIDEVIDPADTRIRLIALLDAAPTPPPRQGKKRPMIDTW